MSLVDKLKFKLNQKKIEREAAKSKEDERKAEEKVKLERYNDEIREAGLQAEFEARKRKAAEDAKRKVEQGGFFHQLAKSAVAAGSKYANDTYGSKRTGSHSSRKKHSSRKTKSRSTPKRHHHHERRPRVVVY